MLESSHWEMVQAIVKQATLKETPDTVEETPADASGVDELKANEAIETTPAATDDNETKEKESSAPPEESPKTKKKKKKGKKGDDKDKKEKETEPSPPPEEPVAEEAPESPTVVLDWKEFQRQLGHVDWHRGPVGALALLLLHPHQRQGLVIVPQAMESSTFEALHRVLAVVPVPVEARLVTPPLLHDVAALRQLHRSVAQRHVLVASPSTLQVFQ